MPLEQRVVTPIQCGRHCVPMDQLGQLAIAIPNELECVTNGTLANIIRQLSSLSRFAEDLFAAILQDASLLVVRAADLQQRIRVLGDKVTVLDSAVEEVSLQDIHLRKAFKSQTMFDQQVVSRETIPQSLVTVYQCCDRPPPLQKLNPYRDDGKDGLKFYTDPNYFFDLWRMEMLAETELRTRRPKEVKREKRERRHKVSHVRPPVNSRERFQQLASNHGEFILQHAEDTTPGLQQQRPNSLEVSRVPNDVQFQNHVNNQLNQFDQRQLPQQQQSTPTRRQQQLASRPSQPPPAPPSNPPTPHRENVQRMTLPPPPPPPPELNGDSMAMNDNSLMRHSVAHETIPPPPPPLPSSVELNEAMEKLVERREQVKQESKAAQAQKDPRSDLLQAIREGIKLKRVEDCKQREVEKSTPLHDVASILARRVAIELSDSEGGQDEEEDSDAWDDESEC